MKDTRELKLSFGMFEDSLRSQLDAQKYKYRVSKIVSFEQSRKALITLWTNGIIGEKTKRHLQIKLMKKIILHLKNMNKK
jgi:hypothetical protein